MKYKLNDRVCAITFDNCIRQGVVSSVRITTYERYGSKGAINYSKYIEYAICDNWYHEENVFNSRIEVISKIQSNLHSKLTDLMSKIDLTNKMIVEE